YAFQGVFLLAVGLSLAALIAVTAPRLAFHPSAQQRRRVEIYNPSTLPVATAVAFLAFAYGAVTTFLPLFAVSIDVHPRIYFLAYALALSVARPVAGTLSDRYGEAAVIVPATFLTTVALLVLSAASGLAGVITAA